MTMKANGGEYKTGANISRFRVLGSQREQHNFNRGYYKTVSKIFFFINFKTEQ